MVVYTFTLQLGHPIKSDVLIVSYGAQTYKLLVHPNTYKLCNPYVWKCQHLQHYHSTYLLDLKLDLGTKY